MAPPPANNSASLLPTNTPSDHEARSLFGRATSGPFHKQWMRHLAANLARFFRATWLDWLLLLSIGAATLGVWHTHPSTTQYFPLLTPDGALYRPDLAYPYVEPLFSSALAGILSAGIPIAGFAATQLWLAVREKGSWPRAASFDDFATAVLGLAYAMFTGTAAQVVLKKTIGGLRPHFLSVCLPRALRKGGAGFREVMVTPAQVCTGDETRVRNALESFPSGHAEVAFAGLGYLAIYLFMRVCWERRGGAAAWGAARYLQVLVVVAPLLFASYLAATLVRGYHHHVGDVLFGAGIGWTVAVLGYFVAFGEMRHRRREAKYLVAVEGSEMREESGR